MASFDRAAAILAGLGRVLTQYRESPNLLAVIRHGLEQITEVTEAICAIPSKFEIDSSVGHQLTCLGERMGWPRAHCVCTTEPLFGFDCGGAGINQTIVGFCEEGTWENCAANGVGELVLSDDEVYRGYVLARRYQARQMWDIDSLQAAAQHIWGPTATITNLGRARVAVAPGRALTEREERELPLAFRVLPFAPGISTFLDRTAGPVFGFGTGWSGFCENAEWLCPTLFDPYSC